MIVIEQPEIEYVTGNSPTMRVPYRVLGAATVAEARAALFAVAPASRSGLVRRSIRTSETFLDDLDAGTSFMEASVDYAESGTLRQPVRTTRWAFEISGKTFKITQSLETRGRYAAAGAIARDFKGAINVTHDGVEGCEIVVPDYTFSRTLALPAGDVAAVYKRSLFDALGKTNLDKFEEFEPGEALFVGVSGSEREDGDWELVQRFAASPHKYGFYVGDILIPEKRGWEYLWVRYEDEEDATAKALVKRPVAVYVERVYEESLFSALLPAGGAYSLASDYFATF